MRIRYNKDGSYTCRKCGEKMLTGKGSEPEEVRRHTCPACGLTLKIFRTANGAMYSEIRTRGD